MMPLSMTVTDAAKLIGLSRATAYEAVKRGEIPTVRINGRLLVPTAQLYAMFGQTPPPPHPTTPTADAGSADA